MINTVIALLILLLSIVPLFIKTQRARKSAWQWWAVPWLSLVFVVVAFVVYHQVDISTWPVFSSLFDDYQYEAAYVLLCWLVWLVAGFGLRRPAVHEALIPLFRKVFAPQRDDRDTVLPFPYFADSARVVRSRVGKSFYRRLLSALVVIVACVYALFFLLVELVGIDFYLLSAFGLFGLLPLADYCHYLKAEVPEEKQRPGDDNDTPEVGDLEKLWQLYTETFPDYAVAWKRKHHREQEADRDNQALSDDLIEHIRKGGDGFLENSDLVSAFRRMEQLFNWEEENGRLVLLVLDIPNHFSQSTRLSFLQEIADEMRQLLRKDLNVYDEYSPNSVLNSSIVLASLTVLSMRDLDEDWLRRIGLVMVVNLFDKSLSNLYECRRFSYLLRAAGGRHQLLFVTPHLRDVEPSLKNVWVTVANTLERRIKQIPTGYNQFFIGYDIENYLDRFRRILQPLPSEPLSAGSEMAPIALSHKNGDEPKAVTPVHFFDLAYSNIVEGIEELGKFYQGKFFPVRADDMNKHIHSHLLPLDRLAGQQMFSVVFDQDNNAPAAYARWMHQGSRENLSVVVSRPYLLRDYFNANHDYFLRAPFIALQPCLSKSRVTLALILLEMLQKSEMTERQLRGLLQGYYHEAEIRSVSSVVQQLFTTYFLGDLAGRLKTRHHVVFDGSQYQYQTIYQLDFSDSVNLSYLDRIFVKDESDNVLFVIIKDLLFQNFDRGQVHSFLGKPYEVCSFDSANKVLRVKAVNTRSANVFFYRAAEQLALSGPRRPVEGLNHSSTWSHPGAGQELGLSFEGFETLLTVGVSRWYEFCRYSVNDCTYHDAQPASERKYENGRVLKVTLRFLRKKEYLDRRDDIRKSLQLLIYEAMQSVFPHHAQYLLVSTVGEGDPDLPWIFNRFTGGDQDEPGTISFYFTEDAHIDLGLIGALANKDNFGGDYLFRYIYDYLIWLTEGEPVPSADYDAYLSGQGRDKLAFLKYGRDALPPYFDVNLLINFIRDFFCEGQANVLQGVTERNRQQDVYGVCDFCRQQMKNSEMQALGDGRMRCPDCSAGAIDTVAQFNSLCGEAKALFKQHLNIDFDTMKYQSKFVSAVELHKVYGKPLSITNGYDVRALVGLALSGKYVIYVENGRKPMDTLGIIVHEMTHIWQFYAPEFKQLRKDENWTEGLAVWTDLYLTAKKGATDTEERRRAWLERSDEYGRGLKYIMEHCPDNPYDYIRSHPDEPAK